MTWWSYFVLVLQTADAEEEGKEDAGVEVGEILICRYACMASVVVMIPWPIPNMQAGRASSPLIAKHASFSAVCVQPTLVALRIRCLRLMNTFWLNRKGW